MLSRSTKDVGAKTQFGDAGACPVFPCRKMLLTFLLSIALCTALGAKSEAAENEKCGEALNQIATKGFKDQSIGLVGSSACTPDVLSYAGFVGFVLSSKSDPTAQELQDRLLKSAESGYLSAKIIYTLVFTDVFDSQYSNDLSAKQSYSRYAPYILSLRLFGEWRQDQIVDKFFLASQFANEAVRQGVIEAHLLKHFFNYVQYKGNNNEASKGDAAVSLLVLASFLNRTEMARQHLIKFLALDRAELESFEADSQSAVARILADPENSVCGQDKECVLGLSIKRVVCDFRDRNGQILYRIDKRSCTRLSEPLTRLYRQIVANAFDSFISGMKP